MLYVRTVRSPAHGTRQRLHLDCPDTCSLTVTVEDERIVKVRGSEAMPFTDGVICNKVAQDMAAFVHGP